MDTHLSKILSWTVWLVIYVGIVSCKKSDSPNVNDSTNTEDVVSTDSDETHLSPILKFDGLEEDKLYSMHKQKDTLEVESNVPYQASSDVDWLKFPKKMKAGAAFIFEIAKNEVEEPREGSITLTTAERDEVTPIKLRIRQRGNAEPFISVSREIVDLNPSELFFEVDITSNIDYEINLPPWISTADVEVLDEEDLRSYTFKVEEARSQRSATIQILGKGDSWDISADIQVSQPKTTFEDPAPELPVASLFDVAFTPEGAKDYSPFQFKLKSGGELGGADPTISFDEGLKMYVASFNKARSTFYRLDYDGLSDFIEGFKNSFTIEVYFKPAKDHEEHSTILGSMEANGIGVQHYTLDGPTVLYYTTTDYNDKWYSIEGKEFNAGVYDHLVFTYDGRYMTSYVNGEEKTKQETTGRVELPNNGAHWFGFGGDATTVEAAADYFTGEMAFARFYDESKSGSEVKDLYTQIINRGNLTTIGDLKNALENTLPDKLSAGTGQEKEKIQQLLDRGWKMISNLATTDPMIEEFLDEINNLP